MGDSSTWTPARRTVQWSSSSSRSATRSVAWFSSGPPSPWPSRCRAPAVPGRAAQHRAHPRDQGLDGERLGDVVVAADRQPGDRVGGGVPRGQEDDRHVVGHRPQPPADLEPVDVGEQHVEHDQVGLVGVRELQRVLARRAGGHGAAVKVQCHLNEFADVRLVVDDEHSRVLDAFCHGSLAANWSRMGSCCPLCPVSRPRHARTGFSGGVPGEGAAYRRAGSAGSRVAALKKR